MTHDDIRELIESLRVAGDERTPDAMFAARYGRNLTDLAPEHALSVMYAADRAAAGTSDMGGTGRYNAALLARRPAHVEGQYARRLAMALHEREERER